MSITDAPNLNYAWADLIIEELVRNGVTCFCIAPGSRSSPLTAAAARHPKAEKIIHFDERGLGFYALGRVSASGRPVALICSSGTAAVNFFPAVVETSKKKLPLIILTADRPPELRLTGAMQTIDQVKLYGDYVRWHVDLPVPDAALPASYPLTTVDQAVYRSRHPMGGPVHINCMFREPLAPVDEPFDRATFLAPVKQWLENPRVYTSYRPEYFGTASHDRPPAPGDEVLSILRQTRRGIIVVGKLASERVGDTVLELAKKLGWPVFPDIVSGLRMGREHPNLIHYFDQLLLPGSPAHQFPIDTVLHLGGRITSKRWYQYMEKQKPRNYITVLSHPLRNDPLHRVTLRIHGGVEEVATRLLAGLGKEHFENDLLENDYLKFFRRGNGLADRVVEGFIAAESPGGVLTEIGTARLLSRLLPAGHGLFLSNSMPVREMDMYAVPGGNRPEIGANRGASGIDGIIATARGFSTGLGEPTTLLIGDLAGLHDLNSLALLKKPGPPLIILLINNDGGGIFSFLPIAGNPAASDIFDTYFGTPHGLEFSHAAAMFGLDYQTPRTPAELETAYKDALAAGTPTLMEVRTGRDENHKQHSRLQKKIVEVLNQEKY